MSNTVNSNNAKGSTSGNYAKDGFRLSMKWLHTWSGLGVAVVLYFMFITGSAGYFNDEITYWMQPEMPLIDNNIDQQKMLVMAEKRLAKVAPKSSEWWIEFPIGREYALSIEWPEKTNKDEDNDGKMDVEWKDEILDLHTGKPLTVRKTGGGGTLYYMHYALHYIPSILAYWITSLCAMFMLVGLISGIVIHKQIFKDFFTFRPGKNQYSWRDMHNVLSVLPMPFHIMITYSGLLFFMSTTMPGVITGSYGQGEKNQDRFYDAIYTQEVAHKNAAGIDAKNISLSRVFTDAEQRWGKNKISSVSIENRGDINAHIEIRQYGYNGLESRKSLTYNAVTGELQHASDENENEIGNSLSTPTQFYDIMITLHEGSFAGSLLRWLYFISGLMGAGMIASGMILWASKRRERAEKKGFASNGLIFLERLNVGSIVGLLIAIAVYFWMNRLLPVSFSGRENWEINSLFISWVVMLAYPFIVTHKLVTHKLFAHKRTINQIWIDQLTIAALLFGLLPVLNFFTTNTHLGNTLLSGNWVLAGFDITMLVFSGCFAYSAYRLFHKKNKPVDATRSIKKNNSRTVRTAHNNHVKTVNVVKAAVESAGAAK